MALSVIGVGGNLPAPGFDTLEAGLDAALAALAEPPLALVARSSWHVTAPSPPSDQPWYRNAVVVVRSDLSARAMLDHLLGVERRFGRARGARNAARTLDLDLLDHDGIVAPPPADPELPHPRLTERAFVLLPLAEAAPDWRHPATGRSVAALIAALGPSTSG